MHKIISEDLYKQIVRVMPIPCVDLLISNTSGEVLLVKRKNEPAKNQWWFAGGRVLYMESRKDAVKRKLFEECGLEAQTIKELGTFDVTLKIAGTEKVKHGITTLYHVNVISHEKCKVDDTIIKAEWHTVLEWKKELLHPFVCKGLSFINKHK